MDIRLSKLIDCITADNFKEVTEEIINLLNMPHNHISGIYSFIAQANYMIGSGRNKYSDEYIRESFREEVESSLEQLEKYGPLKRAKVVNGKVVLSHHK
jgi:hypothetical protein